MVEVMITKINVGRSIGNTTERKVRHLPTTAASSTSFGMACMAARKISVL